MGSHTITSTSWSGLVSLSLGVASPAAGQVDQQRAEACFQEAAAICQRDGGRLWGVSSCGPMVIADARTGTIATSQPPPPAERPRALGFANAPVEWGGLASGRPRVGLHGVATRREHARRVDVARTLSPHRVEIRAAEQTRAEQRRVVVRELQSRFVDGPVLLVPSGGGATFDAVGARLTGDGWAATVAPGWTVRRGPRSGDYQIVRAPR